MSVPHAVVIGGGGFVGATLAAGFAARGWRVTAVDMAFDAATRVALTDATLVTADVSAGVPSIVPSCDLLVHAAAVTTDPADLGWSNATHLAANTQPLLRVLEFAAGSRPAAFVYLSSSGVFASSDGDGRLQDTDTPTARSAYAVAKRAGELLAPAALDGATQAHVVRLGYLYGPGEVSRPSRRRVSLVARWLDAARAGQPLDVRADDPRREWTWAPDLAPALASLVDTPSSARPLHLCSPHVLADRAMATLISARVPGTKCRTVPAADPLKPPMRPSDIEGWRDLTWTAPATAIAHLAGTEVRA